MSKKWTLPLMLAVDSMKHEKDDFTMIVAAGATGIGKTTFLNALKDIYKDNGNYLPVFITFSKDSTEFKYTTNVDNHISMENLIVSRCQCALNPQLTLREASTTLTFYKLFKNTKKCILLLIDEFNYLPDNRLEEFVTYCGNLLMPSENRPFVVIVTAGTLPGKLGDIFTKSKCPSAYIPLPALSMASMVNQLKATNLSVRKEMYKILLDTCGIPRLFNAIRKCRVLPDTYKEGLQLILEANVSTGESISLKKINKVVSYSLLELPILKRTSTWDDYTSQGYAFLFPSPYELDMLVAKFPIYWININLYYLQQFTNMKKIIDFIYFTMPDSTNGIQFEELACKWLSFKSYLISKLEYPIRPLSLHLGVVVEENIDIKSQPVQLYTATEKIPSGLDSLVEFGSERIVKIEKDKPFLINGVSNQDGIDCIQLLFDSDNNAILVFYQFKLYSSASKAKIKLESSLQKSVAVINSVVEWYKSKFELEIKNRYYLAVVNNCNPPVIPESFQILINAGLKYHFVEGQYCRQFMTSIICERHNIWTKNQKILINIACIESLELLSGIDSVIAANIVKMRTENDSGHFTSLEQLKSEYENRYKQKLGKKALDSLEKNVIW